MFCLHFFCTYINLLNFPDIYNLPLDDISVVIFVLSICDVAGELIKVCLFFFLVNERLWALHQLNLSLQERWAYMIHSNRSACGKIPSKAILAQIQVPPRFYRWMLGCPTRWGYMKLVLSVSESRLLWSDYPNLTIFFNDLLVWI